MCWNEALWQTIRERDLDKKEEKQTEKTLRKERKLEFPWMCVRQVSQYPSFFPKVRAEKQNTRWPGLVSLPYTATITTQWTHFNIPSPVPAPVNLCPPTDSAGHEITPIFNMTGDIRHGFAIVMWASVALPNTGTTFHFGVCRSIYLIWQAVFELPENRRIWSWAKNALERSDLQ